MPNRNETSRRWPDPAHNGFCSAHKFGGHFNAFGEGEPRPRVDLLSNPRGVEFVAAHPAPTGPFARSWLSRHRASVSANGRSHRPSEPAAGIKLIISCHL